MSVTIGDRVTDYRFYLKSGYLVFEAFFNLTFGRLTPLGVLAVILFYFSESVEFCRIVAPVSPYVSSLEFEFLPVNNDLI